MGVLDAGFNALAAHKSWQRQKTMYRHRYQWQVEDMRKAGLNPMLSVMQGAPGTGGAPQAAPADLEGGITKVASNVMQATRLREEVQNIRSQKNLNEHLARKATEDAANSAASARLTNVAAFEKSLGLQAAMNAMQVEQDWGVTGQKIERITKGIGNLFNFGFLFGLPRRGGGGKGAPFKGNSRGVPSAKERGRSLKSTHDARARATRRREFDARGN